MEEMVFLDPPRMKQTPFTTSAVIARVSGIGHRKIKAAIRKYKNELESFRLLASYQAESTGGRPEEFYRLNEEQATFLMTLLKNTLTVVTFKKELVRQFYQMKQELMRREVNRAKLLPARRTLTDAVRDCLPDTPHKSRWYKIYTDLAYKAAVGACAAQIRRERGAAKNANAVEYLTSAEMEAVEKASGQIAVLIESGLSYPEIRDIMTREKE